MFAAETNKEAATDRPAPPIVRPEAIAPAGQTFSRPTTTFSPAIPPEIQVKGGTFSRPETTFSTPAGSFSRPASSFARPEGTFSRPESTFSRPVGTFSRPGSTFLNPTQATSPLPPGAFGAPIRPPSTFARPAGTFSRPEGTFAAPNGAAVATVAPQLGETAAPVTSELVQSDSAQAEPSTPNPAPLVIDLPPGAVVRKAAPPVAVQKK
jgi:hypothetical protein